MDYMLKESSEFVVSISKKQWAVMWQCGGTSERIMIH